MNITKISTRGTVIVLVGTVDTTWTSTHGTGAGARVRVGLNVQDEPDRRYQVEVGLDEARALVRTLNRFITHAEQS